MSSTHKLEPVVASLPKGTKVNLQTLDPFTLHQLARLFPEAYDKVLGAITATLQTVFLVAVPIGALAFALSWFLPELPLRRSISTREVSEGFGLPEPRSSLQEIELSLERIASRENRVELYKTMAQRAGVDLPPQSCWLLYRLADRPGESVQEVAARLKVSREVIQQAVRGLVAAGMVVVVQRGDDHDVNLTPAGLAAMDRLTEARRTGLTELLEGWNPTEHPEIIDLVKELASSLLADDKKMLEDALPHQAEADCGDSGGCGTGVACAPRTGSPMPGAVSRS